MKTDICIAIIRYANGTWAANLLTYLLHYSAHCDFFVLLRRI